MNPPPARASDTCVVAEIFRMRPLHRRWRRLDPEKKRTVLVEIGGCTDEKCITAAIDAAEGKRKR